MRAERRVGQRGRRLVATRLGVGLAVISAAFAWVALPRQHAA